MSYLEVLCNEENIVRTFIKHEGAKIRIARFFQWVTGIFLLLGVEKDMPTCYCLSFFHGRFQFPIVIVSTLTSSPDPLVPLPTQPRPPVSELTLEGEYYSAANLFSTPSTPFCVPMQVLRPRCKYFLFPVSYFSPLNFYL